jgi:hypothetical protein
MSDLRGLIERCEKAREADNRLDCEIDIALFVPDDRHMSVRMNNAGTKLVYTRRGGGTDTHWSFGHTLNAGSRAAAVATLLALQSDTGVGR